MARWPMNPSGAALVLAAAVPVAIGPDPAGFLRAIGESGTWKTKSVHEFSDGEVLLRDGAWWRRGRRMSDANGIQDALHDGSCDVLQDLGGLGGRRRNGNWWLWVASNRQPNELIKSHFTNSELSMYRYAYRHVPSLVSGTIRVHPLFLAVSISTSMHRCVLRLPQQPWATYIGSYRTRRPLVHRGIDTGTCA